MERQRAPPKGREAENGSRGIDSRGRIPERLCRCHSRYAQEKEPRQTNYSPYYNKISADVRVNYSLTTTLLWY